MTYVWGEGHCSTNYLQGRGHIMSATGMAAQLVVVCGHSFKEFTFIKFSFTVAVTIWLIHSFFGHKLTACKWKINCLRKGCCGVTWPIFYILGQRIFVAEEATHFKFGTQTVSMSNIAVDGLLQTESWASSPRGWFFLLKCLFQPTNCKVYENKKLSSG